MTYFVTTSDGTGIAYDCMGEGAPVVLIHGFGANRKITWANTSWYQTVERAGRKLIAIDCRGHGESDKPHAPADYAEGRMATDIIAVLAALEIPETDLIGYSMGAQLALRLMYDAPGRVRHAVLGGIGDTYFRISKICGTIAKALSAKDASTITDPAGAQIPPVLRKAGDDCWRWPRACAGAAALSPEGCVPCRRKRCGLRRGRHHGGSRSPELGGAEMLIIPSATIIRPSVTAPSRKRP
jgi:pimeloyl-ACP methyl ester carboxylesterase